VFGVFGSCSVRGLGTGVDVGAAAPESSSHGVSSFLLGPMSHRLEWCAASGPVCRVVVFSVFASFSYKLIVSALGISLNIPLYRFSASFFLKTDHYSSLNKKAELLPVALKKNIIVLDTSIFAKGNMDQRGYFFLPNLV
jgi:hypothetical protein